MSDLISQLLTKYTYEAAFTVLLLCGLGLPLPEEVTLIGSGILLYKGQVEFVHISVVCGLAILLGDSIPYWIGRRWGPAALRLRWVSRVMHPERFAKLQQMFKDHGQWTTFGCRVLPGLRIPGYFVAGMMGMRYWRFILLDTAGVLITVPVSIYIGKLLGGQMDELHKTMKNFHLLLGFLVIVAVIFAISWKIRAKRGLNGKNGHAAPPSPPSPPTT